MPRSAFWAAFNEEQRSHPACAGARSCSSCISSPAGLLAVNHLRFHARPTPACSPSSPPPTPRASARRPPRCELPPAGGTLLLLLSPLLRACWHWWRCAWCVCVRVCGLAGADAEPISCLSTRSTALTRCSCLLARSILKYLPRAYANGSEDYEARENVHSAATIAGETLPRHGARTPRASHSLPLPASLPPASLPCLPPSHASHC